MHIVDFIFKKYWKYKIILSSKEILALLKAVPPLPLRLELFPHWQTLSLSAGGREGFLWPGRDKVTLVLLLDFLSIGPVLALRGDASIVTSYWWPSPESRSLLHWLHRPLLLSSGRLSIHLEASLFICSTNIKQKVRAVHQSDSILLIGLMRGPIIMDIPGLKWQMSV